MNREASCKGCINCMEQKTARVKTTELLHNFILKIKLYFPPGGSGVEHEVLNVIFISVQLTMQAMILVRPADCLCDSRF